MVVMLRGTVLRRTLHAGSLNIRCDLLVGGGGSSQPDSIRNRTLEKREKKKRNYKI